MSIILVIFLVINQISNTADETSEDNEKVHDHELENDLEEDDLEEQPAELQEGEYINPVFEPVLADPSIIRVDEYFYAYGTEDDWADGRGSRYVPIIRSRDLVEWEFVSDAFEGPIQWKEGWIWAPDIAEFNDQYYLYYSVSTWGDENPAIGVAISDSPEGPFEDYGKVTDTEAMNGYTIDPQLYVDEDTPYLFFGGIDSGIFAVELDGDGLSTVGDSIQVIGKGYEAPYVIKRNDYYYFFGSNGTCCNGEDSTYNVNVGRSENLLGPYENEHGLDMMNNRGKPVLFGYTSVQDDVEQVVGPGHNAIITDDSGDDWIVYHGILADKPRLSNGANRRALFIDKINWIDDWPEVEGVKPSNTAQPAPNIDSLS